jgi:broad specificity phosphatase PhoE
MKTAEILARFHPEVKVVAVDGIKEINHGHWEGKTRQEIEKEYGDEYRAWEIDPFTCE